MCAFVNFFMFTFVLTNNCEMIKDRIEKIIRDEGITLSKFADEIGVQRSSISHILSGRNKPGFDILQNILNRYRNVNAEWFIQGIGDVYKSGGTIVNTNILDTKERKPVIQETNPTLPSQETEVINTVKNDDFTENKVRTIEKIVVFYSDNSFEEYFSRQ